MLSDLAQTVLKAVDDFHCQLALKLPGHPRLSALRAGIKINLWLERQRHRLPAGARVAAFSSSVISVTDLSKLSLVLVCMFRTTGGNVRPW